MRNFTLSATYFFFLETESPSTKSLRKKLCEKNCAKKSFLGRKREMRPKELHFRKQPNSPQIWRQCREKK